MKTIDEQYMRIILVALKDIANGQKEIVSALQTSTMVLENVINKIETHLNRDAEVQRLWKQDGFDCKGN